MSLAHALPPRRHPHKRSVKLHGLRTSFNVEEPFFAVLGEIAALRGIGLQALVQEIDSRKQSLNLSAALRVYALTWLRALASGRVHISLGRE